MIRRVLRVVFGAGLLVTVLVGIVAADMQNTGTPRGAMTPGITPAPGGHPLPTPAGVVR